MPRPADHVNMSRILNGSERSRAHPSQAWSSWIDRTKTAVVRNLSRPASVSNPVREDGSRAQGSYNCHSRFQQSLVAHVVGNGTSGSQFEFEGNFVYDSLSQLPSLLLSQRLVNDARMKALSGMVDGTTQFNAAGAELKSTLQSLTGYYRHASRGLREMFGDFPKKTRERLKHTPAYNWREIPSDYLGWLYGLAPLADDVENGLDQLTGFAKCGMTYSYWVRAGAVREDSFDMPLTRVGARGPASYTIPAKRKSFARVGYEYRFPDWWIKQTPVVAPFSTAWELTRLSFVCDWVLPIGSWVQSMEAAQFDPHFYEGFEVLGAREVTVDGARVMVNQAAAGSNWPDGSVVCNPPSCYRSRKFASQRTALSKAAGDSPYQRVQFPDFRAEMGVGHVSQALSLFAQRFYKAPASWYRS